MADQEEVYAGVSDRFLFLFFILLQFPFYLLQFLEFQELHRVMVSEPLEPELAEKTSLFVLSDLYGFAIFGDKQGHNPSFIFHPFADLPHDLHYCYSCLLLLSPPVFFFYSFFFPRRLELHFPGRSGDGKRLDKENQDS